MYLVIGGAGFFGEVLIKKLLNNGAQVKSLDLNTPKIIHKNLQVYNGDIRDESFVNEVLKEVDIVHHNIAQVPLNKNKNTLWSVNYDGTKNILNASINNNVTHFVYTSSSAVYGIPKNNPIYESSSKNPIEEYGKAKLAGETLCHEYEVRGLNCSIIRPRTILEKHDA